MIGSIEIRNTEIERSYFMTVKDDKIWLENEDEESLALTEMQLYQAIDEYFRREL